MKAKEYSSHLVPRVALLDAQLLDSDIIDIVKTSLLDSVRYAGVGIYTRLEPEIDALLRLAIYRGTLVKNRATAGQALLQMKYSEAVSRKHLANYTLCLVFLQWLHKRLSDIMRLFLSEHTRSSILGLVTSVEVVYSAAHIVNILVFLHQGYYSTLAERAFKLRPVPTAPPHSRQISYSFFSRELLWHGFAELLGAVLPLIPAQSFHSFVKSFLPSHAPKKQVVRADPEDSDVTLTVHTVCCVCGCTPVLPHEFGCSHVSCYYCVYSQHSKTLNWSCPLCGHVIESIAQIRPV